MSDRVLKIVPIDQDYVPSSEAQQQAIALLRQMLPDGEMHEAQAYDELRFIDQGENCEAVFCPSCARRVAVDPFTGTDVARQWYYDLDTAVAKAIRISELQTTMPCCGARVPFTSLRFHWPAGFARFTLSVWNPDIDEGYLTADQLSELESVLGCKLAQIEAHY